MPSPQNSDGKDVTLQRALGRYGGDKPERLRRAGGPTIGLVGGGLIEATSFYIQTAKRAGLRKARSFNGFPEVTPTRAPRFRRTPGQNAGTAPRSRPD